MDEPQIIEPTNTTPNPPNVPVPVVSSTAREAQKEAIMTKKSSKKPFVLPILAVCLVGIGVVAYLLVRTNDQPKAATTAPSVAAKSVSTLSIGSNGFQPATLSAKVGTTVTIVNNDSAAHQFAARNQNGAPVENFGLDEALEPKDSYSFVFEKKGTYIIYDKLNTQISGTVTITEN